ncbi:hypothetical protein HEP87_60555 [Streptomyces sp. S1D4-11]
MSGQGQGAAQLVVQLPGQPAALAAAVVAGPHALPGLPDDLAEAPDDRDRAGQRALVVRDAVLQDVQQGALEEQGDRGGHLVRGGGGRGDGRGGRSGGGVRGTGQGGAGELRQRGAQGGHFRLGGGECGGEAGGEAVQDGAGLPGSQGGGGRH